MPISEQIFLLMRTKSPVQTQDSLKNLELKTMRMKKKQKNGKGESKHTQNFHTDREAKLLIYLCVMSFASYVN